MTNRGEHSLREITTQGESWRSAIDETLRRKTELTALLKESAGGPIIFIGCGSTHYLAQFAAAFFQGVTGISCRSVPSSELLLQTESVVARGQRPLVIALSRSGETTETINAVEKLRARGSEAITISCYGQTALAAASSVTVAIPGGQEESYAQTRSFAGMLVAVQVLAALVAGDDALLADLQRLPALAPGVIRRAAAVAQSVGPDESIARITYLASGALAGLAGEAMVKMKEMSLSVAEAFHFMEFRHGPMALVDPAHLIVALLSDRVRAYELGVLRDLRKSGGRLLVMANDGRDGASEFGDPFLLDAPLTEPARAVLYLPLLQLLAYHRSMARGLNPDRPRNVVMAIRLSGTEVVS